MKKLILVVCLALPVAACSVMGEATPAEQTRIEQLDDVVATGTPEEAAAAEAELEDLETSIAGRSVDGVWKYIKGFIPGPLQPFTEWMFGAAGLMVFNRPRKRAKKMVKNVASGITDIVKGNFESGAGMLGDSITDVFKTFGLMHSNSNPLDIMRGAIKAARAKGDEAIAVAIEAKLVELEATVSA